MSNLHEQRQKVEAEIRKLEEMGGSFSGRAKQLRDSAFSRFPAVFVLLSSFGLVATFYGFEKVIDQVDWLVENPHLLLLLGILTLLLTGTLYKKLQ